MIRQRRKRVSKMLNQVISNDERSDIGIRHVPIINLAFFPTQSPRFVAAERETTRFALDHAAGFEEGDLAGPVAGDCASEGAERRQILGLGALSEAGEAAVRMHCASPRLNVPSSAN